MRTQACREAGREIAEETPETPADEISEAPGLSDTIVLPAGWEISDAISAAEAEAIVGGTGYAYRHENLSDPAAGNPQGSYYDDSLTVSRINSLVYAMDGRSNNDRVPGSEDNTAGVPGGLRDMAVVGEMTDVGEILVGMLVLRGDVYFRVRWNPASYHELDSTETSVKLAVQLIDNLYGGDRAQ